MSKIITVGLKLGASLDNAFSSIFTSANATVNRLGKTTDALKKRQDALGQAMSRSFSYPLRNVGTLRTQYDKLGQSLEKLKSKQDKYNAAVAKQKSLIEQRESLGKEMIGTAAAAWANAQFLRQSVGSSAQFKDNLRDTRINGNLSANDESAVGQLIRQNVESTNQNHHDLASGVGQLVEAGTSVNELQGYTKLLGQSLTGLRVNVDQGAATFIALRDMGVDNEEKMQQMLDKLVWSGQQGNYGLQNMFATIGEFDDLIKSNKLGLDSLGDMTAMLQIGDAAMGADKTKSALMGWLDEMNSNRRAEAFSSAYKSIDPNSNFDYKASMSKAVADGFSEFEASMKIAGGFLQDKMGSSGVQELLNANGNDEKQHSLIAQFGLSEVFKDKNQINMVLAYLNKQDEFQRIKQADGATGSLGNVFDLRMNSPLEQFKSFGNNIKELSITIGDALLPPVLTLVNALNPIIKSMSSFVAEHPNITAGIIGIATAIVGIKVATLGASWGMNFFVKSPLATLNTLLAKTGLNLSAFNSKMLLGSKAGSGVGGMFTKVGAGIGFIGKTIATVGRAMLLNPIGLIITGIAIAALLIYKYWEPISAFFSGVFAGLSEALSPIGEAFSDAFAPIGELLSPVIDGLSAIWGWFTDLFTPVNSTAEALEGATSIGHTFGQIIGGAISFALYPIKLLLKFIGFLGNAIRSVFEWSPMETISSAWSGVTGWFDNLVTTITDIGGNIIDGLIGGITSKITSIKETIVNIGSAIGDWFKETLGIKSPSRVFIGFGENVSEGAAIGIESETGLVKKAALGLAAATAITLSPAVLANDGQTIQRPNAAVIASSQQSNNAGSPIVINFSPNITISGGATTKEQVNQALSMSFAEFEVLMRKYQHQLSRRSYRGIDK